MKKKLRYLPLLFIVLSCPYSPDNDENTSPSVSVVYYWEHIPIRDAAQKAKGYSGGECGQMGRNLAICPSDPDYMALGIDTAGVYVSVNGGVSWENRREGIRCLGIKSVCFDPENPSILYAAGFNGDLDVDNVEGIYRSSDTGNNWTLVFDSDFIDKNSQNDYFAFDPGSWDGTMHRTVYAGTCEDGLLRSTDGGFHWSSLGLTNEPINAVFPDPSDSNTIYVASDNGLLRSENGGGSFSEIGNGLPMDAEIYGFAINHLNSDIMFVAARNDGIWKSTDRGDNFSLCMNGIAAWETDLDWCILDISPADPDYMYADANRAGGMFPYYSHDGGETWSKPTHMEPAFTDLDSDEGGHYWAEGLRIHPTNPLIAFQFSPMRKTVDGGITWNYTSDGISGMRRNSDTSVAFHPDNPDQYVLFHGDFGATVTFDDGDTFEYRPAPRQTGIDDPNNANTMGVGAYMPTSGTTTLVSVIGGWDIQRICRSIDNGDTWNSFPGTEGKYEFIGFSNQEPELVYLGRENDSLRSTDGGVTWDDPIPVPIKAVFYGNGNVVYGTGPADQTWDCEVLRSTDRGDNWTSLGTILFAHRIDVDPSDMDRIYAATDGGIYIFNGNSWSCKDERDGLEKNQFDHYCFRSIVVDKSNPAVLYAGSNESWLGLSNGVFVSRDYGLSWTNISENIGSMMTVWGLSVSPYDGTVWLATDYGNWRLHTEIIEN